MFTIKTTLKDRQNHYYVEFLQFDGKGSKRKASDYLYTETIRPNACLVELFKTDDFSFDARLVSKIRLV